MFRILIWSSLILYGVLLSQLSSKQQIWQVLCNFYSYFCLFYGENTQILNIIFGLGKKITISRNKYTCCKIRKSCKFSDVRELNNFYIQNSGRKSRVSQKYRIMVKWLDEDEDKVCRRFSTTYLMLMISDHSINQLVHAVHDTLTFRKFGPWPQRPIDIAYYIGLSLQICSTSRYTETAFTFCLLSAVNCFWYSSRVDGIVKLWSSDSSFTRSGRLEAVPSLLQITQHYNS